MLNDKAEVVKDYRYGTYGQDEMPEMKVFGGTQSVELWRQEVEKIDNPFRYCGEYLDEETGNYYLRARYYDPSVQRFVNEDSYAIAFGAAWKEHIYNYTGNNPVRFIDPTGHISDPDSISNYIKKAVSKAHTAITSYKANGTWITARKSGNSTAVPVRLISYAYGATVSWDNKSKQAMVNLNGETRWLSSNNFYTEKGQMWIKPEIFKSMFGIKGTGKDKKPTPQPQKASGSNNTPSLGYWLDPKLQIAGNVNFGAKDFGGSVTLVNGHIIIHGQTGAAVPTDMRDLPVNGAVKAGPIWGINNKGDLSGLSGSGTYAPNRYGTTVVAGQNSEGQPILGIQPTIGSKQVSVSIDYSKELFDIDLNPFD